MASAVAHPLFRTPSIDAGTPHSVNGLAAGEFVRQYHASLPPRLPSPLPPGGHPSFLKDMSRSGSATSTQSSSSLMYQQPNFHTRSASLSQGRVEEYNRQQQDRGFLPGLSTLASLASSEKPQLRSVHLHETERGVDSGAADHSLLPQHQVWLTIQYHQCRHQAFPGTTTCP